MLIRHPISTITERRRKDRLIATLPDEVNKYHREKVTLIIIKKELPMKTTVTILVVAVLLLATFGQGTSASAGGGGGGDFRFKGLGASAFFSSSDPSGCVSTDISVFAN